MNNLKEFVSKVDIFTNLNNKELDFIFPFLKEKIIDKDKILFNEGDPGDELFIVQKGSVAISVKLKGGTSMDITKFDKNDFFGEMSIFEGAPRSATCYAKEKSHLLSLKGPDFFNLMDKHPKTATKIMNKMLTITTNRLQSTNAFLTDLVRWGEEARKRAVTDEFTGLFNRRFLDSALDHQFKEAKAGSKPLALAMVDLDHFGKLNYNHGEAFGDKVIKSVVPIFKKVFKKSDILTRYGGDEFSFLLPGRTPEKALELCKKVCCKIQELDIIKESTKEKIGITASIGIACYPKHAKTLKDLIDKTDDALYLAKESGRNKAALFKKRKGNEKK